MLQSASAITFEIDDCEKALAELQQQLSSMPLMQNTIGIMHFDPEFVYAGTVDYIAQHIGFPLAGCTSSTQAVNTGLGDLCLTLLVLTADDVAFIPAHTTGFLNDPVGTSEQAFAVAAAQTTLPIRMALLFPPMQERIAGDFFADIFERLAPGLPTFGAISIDETISSYTHCRTICGGGALENEFAFVLVCGNVNPRFISTTVPNKALLPTIGSITRASGNKLEEIDGKPAVAFFEQLSLAKDGKLGSGVDLVPVLLNPEAAPGKPVSPYIRGILNFDENGAALFRGHVDKGASITIGSLSKSVLLDNTTELADALNGEEVIHALILFSCIVRRCVCGETPQAEAELVRARLKPDVPFIFAYAGGELCPMRLGNNSFQNFSLIACIL